MKWNTQVTLGNEIKKEKINLPLGTSVSTNDNSGYEDYLSADEMQVDGPIPCFFRTKQTTVNSTDDEH